MYLHSNYGLAAPAPAPPPVCPADTLIAPQTAMLFSPQAPLAAQRASHCDFRAVWAFVPSGIAAPLSVLYYFHGNNNWVTASAANPNGRLPAWTRRYPSPLVANGAVAAGPKYQLNAAAQAAPGKPIVLAPQVGVPVTGSFWAAAAPGAFATDQSRLTALTADCFSRLQALRAPGGAPVLSPALRPAQVGRLFLAGHSGGERPLQGACRNSLVRTLPTELWLYDCTYSASYNQHYRDWALHWFRSGSGNRLGNGRGMCRMMLFTTGGRTAENAAKLLTAMQQAGIPAARFSGGGMRPRGRGPLPAAPLAVEVAAGTPLAAITGLMARFPVLFIHTSVAHDRIPLFWTPHLLATAPPA